MQHGLHPHPPRRSRTSGSAHRKQITSARCRPPLAAAPAQQMVTANTPALDLALYDDDHSLFCAKVKVALYAKRLHFTSVALSCGTTASTEYTQVNPLKKIPALVVTHTDSAQPPMTLIESSVIIEWLDDVFSQPNHPSLLPEDPNLRAQVRMLAAYHDHYLEPSLRQLYSQVAPRHRDPERVRAAVSALQERLDTLEVLVERAVEFQAASSTQQGSLNTPDQGSLGGPMPGAPFGCLTVADCGYLPAFLYIDMIVEAVAGSDALRWPRRVQEWKSALQRHPACQAVLTTLQPAAQHWLDGKLAMT